MRRLRIRYSERASAPVYVMNHGPASGGGVGSVVVRGLCKTMNYLDMLLGTTSGTPALLDISAQAKIAGAAPRRFVLRAGASRGWFYVAKILLLLRVLIFELLIYVENRLSLFCCGLLANGTLSAFPAAARRKEKREIEQPAPAPKRRANTKLARKAQRDGRQHDPPAQGQGKLFEFGGFLSGATCCSDRPSARFRTTATSVQTDRSAVDTVHPHGRQGAGPGWSATT